MNSIAGSGKKRLGGNNCAKQRAPEATHLGGTTATTILNEEYVELTSIPAHTVMVSSLRNPLKSSGYWLVFITETECVYCAVRAQF